MKLYHFRDIAGESWQLPGQQDKKAARVDVPDKAAELCAWLNERRVPVEAGPPVELQLATDPQLAPGGAVIDDAEVARVNAQRPTFLPRLSAEEIERARLAANKCPKCGNGLSLHDGDPVERILAWTDEATDEELLRLVDGINDRAAARGQGRVN